MIKCLEANTDILRFHYHFTDAKERKTNRPRNPLIPGGTERRGGL